MRRPWPEDAFLREITGNAAAVYVAARAALQTGPSAAAGAIETPGRDLVGFAGAWVLVDELHVTTIAVHPAWRRRGVGTSLMLRLVERSLERGIALVTLEVRPSNATARALYERLGFSEVGRRRGYYADTGEDALIMSTPRVRDPRWRSAFERWLIRAYPFES